MQYAAYTNASAHTHIHTHTHMQPHQCTHTHTACALGELEIIKRISRVPIYHTCWEHRTLYNNTHNTHTLTHTQTHTHTHARTHKHTHAHTSDRGRGMLVKKDSLEIVIE